MSERESNFINSIISENTEYADSFILSSTKEELIDVCFGLSDQYGLLLIYYLSNKFIETKNIKILEIVMSLLVTKFSYWEGKDFFEISLFKKALVFFPGSVSILESLLSYSLPPYNKNAFDSIINFDKTSQILQHLAPESAVLKEYLLHKGLF